MNLRRVPVSVCMTARVSTSTGPAAHLQLWPDLEHRRHYGEVVDRGKRVLQVPQGVTFSVDFDPPKIVNKAFVHPSRTGRRLLSVNGPKGTVKVEIPAWMSLNPPLETLEKTIPKELRVSIDDERINRKRAMWNTVNTHIGNALEGVTTMHEAQLNLVGVGYRVSREDPPFAKQDEIPPWLKDEPPKKELPRLVFRVGYSDDRFVDIPEGWDAVVKSPTHVTIKGPDKMKLGNYCNVVRNMRRPEPYNGKGIFVNGETIKRKEVRKR